MGGITGEGFSSPLLGKVFDLLLRRANEGLSTQLSALSGHLSGEEMDHLAYVVSQPESLAHSQQSIRDYISVIQREAHPGAVPDRRTPCCWRHRESIRKRKHIWRRNHEHQQECEPQDR